MESDCLKKVTLDDIHLIQRYLSKCEYEESNHNILNLMIWLDFFRIEQWHDDDVMILICTHKGFTFAYMPLCERRYFLKGIERIREIFTAIGKPLALNCYTEEYKNLVLNVYPDYPFQEYREIFDYVYETEKFRTFSGKSLQKKRNHLNAFYREYGDRYRYEDLNETNLEECLEFMDEWKEEDDDEFLIYERLGFEKVCRHYREFPCKGGLIRIDGHVKAFVVASELSATMCQINVEKADATIRGLYQAIVKEFMSRNFLDKKWVNREDDMGKDHLRQAKMAYDPSFLIKKYLMRME